MSTKSFRITDNKGFHITFENGYTVSVQFGPGNYCDNYKAPIGKSENCLCGKMGSSTAECAVWKNNEDMIAHALFGGDMVGNRMTAEEVLELLNWAASQK